MPWYNYRRRYNRWRRRPWFRRPRKTFRTRRYFRRSHWVRRRRFKKKLKKLSLLQYQPKSIRKCAVKGLLCLFQTTQSRLSYNFDMYEESWVPEKLPGGGGFSLKNLSLYSLYIEHTTGHNIFTHTNKPYPLMRYKGCKLKFYQSKNIDYVSTYSNTWPLKSSMAMYNSLQPSIHLMQKHKILIPSKNTTKWRKPYKKKFIPPPTQMQNKWYFQKDLANIPLFMLRTSALSLDEYYVGNRMKSTNISIHTLNSIIIQNRKWGNRNNTWYTRQLGTQTYFLWATTSEITEATINTTKINQLIPLTNTQDYTNGKSYEEYHDTNMKADTYIKNPSTAGNPFMSDYLKGDITVLTSTLSPTQFMEHYRQATQSDYDKIQASDTIQSKNMQQFNWQIVNLTYTLRYNPYKDKGSNNRCWFLSSIDGGHGWDPPGKPDLENENLPLWILFFGYSDFIKKTSQLHRIDEQYTIVFRSQYLNETKPDIIPLSNSFYEGHSPYENEIEDSDTTRWFPSFQMQQEAINDICLSGPGTPKIPEGQIAEAKIEYKFYFKWGGDLPPMETINDPTQQIWYPVPNNNSITNSLQNPTTAPETYLYQFDERRGELTTTATKRISKDWSTKEISLPFTAPRFAETPALQDPQTQTSSEEEEETNLFELLQHQRTKQRNLKLRILETLEKIQNLQ
nr:MAG: ORF1 [TTV-like mini virus]